MNSGAVEGRVNWMLELARFLVPALTAFTAFQAIINLFREQTQWWHLWRLQDHIIVCGLGRKGSCLVDDLLAKGHPLVVIEKNLEPAAADEYQRKGVIVIEGDAADPATLETARLRRASHLVCLLGSDQQNLSIALQAKQLVKGTRKKDLTCIVHLTSEDLLHLVKKSELNSHSKTPFVLEIFNTYQLTAHTLVSPNANQQPLPSHLLVLGLGRLGKQIILQTAYHHYTQPSFTTDFHITVIDRAARAKIETLLNEFPQLASVADFTPIEIDLSFNQALKKALIEHTHQGKFDRVYVCLGNPILGIQVSLTLMEIPNLSGVPFFIRLEKNAGLGSLLVDPITGQAMKNQIVTFDMYENTCSADLVFAGLHEMLAVHLRENYIQGLNSQETKRLIKIPWEAVSEDEKDANRQQASRICHLLGASGYTISPLYDWDAGKLTFEEEEVIQMAKMEHDLWCQWKRSKGWQYGNPRDDKNKIHPDLRPFDKLTKPEQDKNKDFIINLPALLAKFGFQIDKKS